MRTRRPNIHLELTLEPQEKGEARSAGGRGIEDCLVCTEFERPAAGRQGSSIQAVVEPSNLQYAQARVRLNKDALGIDEMTTDDLSTRWSKSGSVSRHVYTSADPVGRDGEGIGDVRLLGVSTTLDRFVQQIVTQVLHGGRAARTVCGCRISRNQPPTERGRFDGLEA